MITLTHRLEKFDTKGRPMITRLIFTVSMFANAQSTRAYEKQEYSYCWLSVIDPTEEQIERFKLNQLAKRMYEDYGGITYVLVRHGKVSGQRVSV